MDSFILGTAGHIDHGKSSLIKALTGTDTDRLEEEKRRGISIVLGYASMVFSSGITVGIIDVPGHAKFIKTMVSGSAGMNGVLLAIAADDGIMAQTREHLLILKLLGVGLIIPVITKIDTVSAETVSVREKEIKDFLKSYGYGSATGNILKVSTKSGIGIPELRDEIERAIKEYTAAGFGIYGDTDIKYQPTKVFLAIDRIMTSKGYGTILAGTLKYGSFSSGDEIQIMPSGLAARVKSIESHNKTIKTAGKSMRISVNVPSIKKESVKYGDVISLKGSLVATDSVLAKFFYDFENKKDLKSHTLLTFMTGGLSVDSNIVILNDEKRVSAGEYSYALFRLKNKISTMSKERFIVRDFGTGRTIGGGIIIDPLPDYKYNDTLKNIYEGMISDKPEESVYGFIAASNTGSMEDIYKKLNLNYSDFIGAAENLRKSGRIITDNKKRFAFLKEDFDGGRVLLIRIINESLKDGSPNFKKGFGKQELYTIFEQDFNGCRGLKYSGIKLSGLFDIIINDLLSEKEILYDDGNIIPKELENRAAPQTIPQEYIGIAEKIENLLNSSGNSVLLSDELENKIKTNKKIFNYITGLMAKQGRIVKIKHDIYYLKEQIDNIKKGLDAFFESNERLEPKDMKEIAGVSRKYAIPLLEYFDHIGYTVKKDGYRSRKD
jgi:selenocysteine-specific elongation factor